MHGETVKLHKVSWPFTTAMLRAITKYGEIYFVFHLLQITTSQLKRRW